MSTSATPRGPSQNPSPRKIEVLLKKTPKLASLLRPPPPDDGLSDDQLVTSDPTPPSRPRMRGMKVSPAIKTISKIEESAEVPTTTPKAFTAGSNHLPTAKSNRGRPKGWKPGMTYRELRGLDPLPASTARRPPITRPGLYRGRRGRAPRATPRQIYDHMVVPYIPFLCEWQSCLAQLRNVETLRRHIMVVHAAGRDKLICQWAKCGRQDRSTVNFASKDEFENHLMEKHLTPFVWHMGDGFGNENVPSSEKIENADGESLPAYLFDKDCKQVTPSIKGQEVEDQIALRERRKRLRQLLIVQQENARSESESQGDDEGADIGI